MADGGGEGHNRVTGESRFLWHKHKGTLSVQQTCAEACVNSAHLAAHENGKTFRTDAINCLVYTSHTDTLSYTDTYMHKAMHTTHRHTYRQANR